MAGERVLDALGKLPTDLGVINARVAEIKPTPSEVGPVYREIYKTSKPGARRLATAYATTLPTIDQHRQVFQSVALSRDAEERRTLIKGYRDAHQDQWIVHAIGQLPAAHGRALMKDYVLSPAGRKDNAALEEVWTYVANLGAEIRFGVSRHPTASRTTTTRSSSSSRTSSTRSRRRSRTSSTAVVGRLRDPGRRDRRGRQLDRRQAHQPRAGAAQRQPDHLRDPRGRGRLRLRLRAQHDRRDPQRREGDVHDPRAGGAVRRAGAPRHPEGHRQPRSAARSAALVAGEPGRRHGPKGRRGPARDRQDHRQPAPAGGPGRAGCAPVGRRCAAGARQPDRRPAGLRGELHAEPDARHREGADRAGQGGRRHRPGDHQRRRPPAHARWSARSPTSPAASSTCAT